VDRDIMNQKDMTSLFSKYTSAVVMASGPILAGLIGIGSLIAHFLHRGQPWYVFSVPAVTPSVSTPLLKP
jgi:hypothetical protein